MCFVTLITKDKKHYAFFPENISLMTIHPTVHCAARESLSKGNENMTRALSSFGESEDLAHENEWRQKSLNLSQLTGKRIRTVFGAMGACEPTWPNLSAAQWGQNAEFFNSCRRWPFCHHRQHKGVVPPHSCNPLSVPRPSVVVFCEKKIGCASTSPATVHINSVPSSIYKKSRVYFPKT